MLPKSVAVAVAAVAAIAVAAVDAAAPRLCSAKLGIRTDAITTTKSMIGLRNYILIRR